MSQVHKMQDHIVRETLNATPAVSGAGISTVFATSAATLSLSQIASIVTILYVLLQSAYLIWRWRRDAHAAKVMADDD